jgi:hypothetical protein
MISLILRLVMELIKDLLSMVDEVITFINLSQVKVTENDLQVDVEFLLVSLGVLKMVLH